MPPKAKAKKASSHPEVRDCPGCKKKSLEVGTIVSNAASKRIHLNCPKCGYKTTDIVKDSPETK